MTHPRAPLRERLLIASPLVGSLALLFAPRLHALLAAPTAGSGDRAALTAPRHRAEMPSEPHVIHPPGPASGRKAAQ
jgi:hypothetical protein